MWPYILTTIAVALFPLALAGYGGHLATLALSDTKAKRKALFIVWGMAFGGVLLFAVSQVVAYRSDTTRDTMEQGFRDRVLDGLTQIIQEPDRAKQKQFATQLKNQIDSSPVRHPLSPPKAKQDSNASIPTDPLPSYRDGSENQNIYPENFYDFVPYVWGFPTTNTGLFQMEMIQKYQIAFRNKPPKPLKISYLQGDPSSYSLALFLQRVYSDAGWAVHITPRTDIAHVTGIYLFQESIENSLEGVKELRDFAKENKIPLLFEEQPLVEIGTFEIWVGRGPDAAKKI